MITLFEMESANLYDIFVALFKEGKVDSYSIDERCQLYSIGHIQIRNYTWDDIAIRLATQYGFKLVRERDRSYSIIKR